jgi:hypothetical protein
MISVLIFSGCTTLPPVPVIEQQLIVPNLPPNLTRPCPEMRLAESSDIEGILRNHTTNMESAGRCRVRHGAIVLALDSLRSQIDAQE